MVIHLSYTWPPNNPIYTALESNSSYNFITQNPIQFVVNLCNVFVFCQPHIIMYYYVYVHVYVEYYIDMYIYFVLMKVLLTHYFETKFLWKLWLYDMWLNKWFLSLSLSLSHQCWQWSQPLDGMTKCPGSDKELLHVIKLFCICCSIIHL